MTKKTDVWMPLYVGDYIAATGRLTTEQHGAYFLIIMDYWKNGPPPDDDQVLAQITRLSPDAWSSARRMLQGLFVAQGGHWHHNRIDREKTKSIEMQVKSIAKAKAAANKRWGNDATSITQALPEQCSINAPSPSPSHNSNKQDNNNKQDIIIVSPPKISAGAEKKKRRLPDDFVLTKKRAALAIAYWQSKSRPDLGDSIRDHFVEFRNHHTQHGKAMASWESAWQTWYTNAIKFTRPPKKHTDKFIERHTATDWANALTRPDGVV